MPIYIDDNYGVYEGMDGPDGEENRRFYREVQKDSVWKKCRLCGLRKKLRRDYDKCNTCMEKLERGEDIG
jgi:hypothetical protein